MKKMPKLPRNKLTRKHLIASAIILALAFGMWIVFGRSSSEDAGTIAEVIEPSAEAEPIRHPLSGLPVAEAIPELPQVYAVMIDNSVDAWPASGTDKAFLVIEAPVEAAIPRVEAFFSADAEVEKIGPVRSARPYFVEWAEEFDALYAHVGGSNAALDLIATSGTFDLNEFSDAAAFWRATDRYAPHNAYTSTERLAAAVERARERARAPELLYGLWSFKNDRPQEPTELASDVTVRFNSDLYTVDWTYDAVTNTYVRSQGYRETETQDGTRIAANNVAVVVTDMEVVDAVGRREVRTLGEGNAWLLQDGKTVAVTWKKPSASERLAFYDDEGNELAMNAGTTWIEVVPDASDMTIE